MKILHAIVIQILKSELMIVRIARSIWQKLSILWNLLQIIERSNLDAFLRSQKCVMEKSGNWFYKSKEITQPFQSYKTMYITICDLFLLFERAPYIKHMIYLKPLFLVGSVSRFSKETQRILSPKDPIWIGYLTTLFNLFCRYSCSQEVLVVAL